MERVSRVSEHFNTKTFVRPASLTWHVNNILVKRKQPFGRPSNPCTKERTLPSMRRVPVSFGGVEGAFRGYVVTAVSLVERRCNSRSLRRGREWIKLKICEGGMWE